MLKTEIGSMRKLQSMKYSASEAIFAIFMQEFSSFTPNKYIYPVFAMQGFLMEMQ